MKINPFRRCVGATLAAIGVASLTMIPAGAVEYSLLTANSSQLINGAYFTNADPQSTGTGVISSFVRLQNSPTQEGYNASARPVMPDVNTSPTFTRDIQLSEVPVVVNPAGAPAGSYYEFLLDINQIANPTTSYISLNKLQIYTAANALTTANTLTALTSNATLRYDMDAGTDNRVQLNYDLNPGSGAGDLFVYVPVGAFGGAGPTSYVYLYSHFGTEAGGTSYPANDGFEEWAVRVGTPTTVPDGGATAILLGCAMLALPLVRRRMKR
jgi:hypothetical protein